VLFCLNSTYVTILQVNCQENHQNRCKKAGKAALSGMLYHQSRPYFFRHCAVQRQVSVTSIFVVYVDSGTKYLIASAVVVFAAFQCRSRWCVWNNGNTQCIVKISKPPCRWSRVCSVHFQSALIELDKQFVCVKVGNWFMKDAFCDELTLVSLSQDAIFIYLILFTGLLGIT